MYRRVYQGGNDETDVGSPALGEGALHITAPEEFFGRTDDEEQQQGDEPRGRAVLHLVDAIDLRTGEGEELLRQLVAYPEEEVEEGSDDYGWSSEAHKTFLQLLVLRTPNQERAISTQALKVIAHQKLRWGAVHCENITNHRRKAMTIAAARRFMRVADR